MSGRVALLLGDRSVDQDESVSRSVMTMRTDHGKWLPNSERGRRVFRWVVWITAPIVAVVIIVIGVQFGWKQS